MNRFKDACVAHITGFVSSTEMKTIVTNSEPKKVLNIQVGSQQSTNLKNFNDIVYRKVEIWDNADAFSWIKAGQDISCHCLMKKNFSEKEGVKREHENFHVMIETLSIKSRFAKKKTDSTNKTDDQEEQELPYN